MLRPDSLPATPIIAHAHYTRYLAQLIHISQQHTASPALLPRILQHTLQQTSSRHLRLDFPSSPAESLPADERYPVTWQGVTYGFLLAAPRHDTEGDILPADLAGRLAQDCGWLLAMNTSAHYVLPLQQMLDDAMQRVQTLPYKQRMVLDLIAHGATNGAIATTLRIQIKTVYTHQRRLYQRLQIHTRWQAVRIGLLASLREPPPRASVEFAKYSAHLE